MRRGTSEAVSLDLGKTYLSTLGFSKTLAHTRVGFNVTTLDFDLKTRTNAYPRGRFYPCSRNSPNTKKMFLLNIILYVKDFIFIRQFVLYGYSLRTARKCS